MNYEEKLQIIQAGCPKLRFSAQFTDQSSQWNYSRHAHPYLELLYFTEGGGGIDVSGQRLCAGILDTIVYPAGWEHQEQASAARKREIICLWIELPELQLEKPIQIRDHDNLFGRLFSYLYREASRPDASEYVLEYGMKLLLTELLRGLNDYRMLIYAVVLIVTMILVWSPGGIAFRERLENMNPFRKKEKEVQ